MDQSSLRTRTLAWISRRVQNWSTCQEQLQKFLNFIATFNPTLVCYAGKFLLCSTFCSSCAVQIARRSSSGESLFQTDSPSRLLLQEQLSHPSPQLYNLGHQQLTFGGKLPLKYQVLLLWPSHFGKLLSLLTAFSCIMKLVCMGADHNGALWFTVGKEDAPHKVV